MSDYQISIHWTAFTRWYNSYFGTNYSEPQGVPNEEFKSALRMLKMTYVHVPGRSDDSKYVLRASDGGEMARQTGLDSY